MGIEFYIICYGINLVLIDLNQNNWKKYLYSITGYLIAGLGVLSYK